MFLSRRAKRLLDLIQWFSKTCQHIFPSQETLADYLKCSIRTVKRALAELRGHLVDVRRRYRRSNVYRLLVGEVDPQMNLFSTEESATPKNPVPILGPTVVTSNKQLSPPRAFTARKKTGIQHHPREDAVPSCEVELKRLAGLEGKRTSPGDRAFVAALQESLDVLRAGILLGRVRKLAQNATTGRNEAIHSLRYFAGSIAEVARDFPKSLLAWYPSHLQKDVDRIEAILRERAS